MVAGIETPRAVAAAKASGAERGRRRLEIVHESLLTKWPRLVRWRAQDEDGAVLRDQLRQAAQLWQQHGRDEDFLWTGTAFREFQVWRERYPGGLTTLEEHFTTAMTGLAQRRRRRRRLAIAASFAILASTLAAFVVLRQQAVGQARRAEDEARRAEASKLLALGQVELEGHPTAALAYAIKSLELSDSHAARIFALRALAAGPVAMVHPTKVTEQGSSDRVEFSPDGAWAVVLGTENLHVVGREGGSPRVLESFPSGTGEVSAAFDAESKHLYLGKDGVVRVLSVPTFEPRETLRLGGSHTLLRSAGAGILAMSQISDEPLITELAMVLVGSPPRVLFRLEGVSNWDIDATGSSLAYVENEKLFVRSLESGHGRPRRVAEYDGASRVASAPTGSRLAVYDEAAGGIRVWQAGPGSNGRMRTLATPLRRFLFDRGGTRVAAFGRAEKELRVDLWSLDAPLAAAAVSFPVPFGGFLHSATFAPDGRWLATADFHAVCFWPLPRRGPRILVGHREGVVDVRFTPDSARLVSVDSAGEIREWGLGPGGAGRTLIRTGNWTSIDMDRRGRFVAASAREGALIVPLDGGAARWLRGFDPATWVMAVALDAEGRRVAAASIKGPRADKVIRVWDLETGEARTLGPTAEAGEGWVGQTAGLGFLADGSLMSAGLAGVRRWSPTGESFEAVAPSYAASHLTVFADSHAVVHTVGSPREAREGGAGHIESRRLAITDLRTRSTRVLASHGDRVMPIAVDSSGSIVVSGGLDGIVRVGPVAGGEPHLLIGHEGQVHTVDVSPDGRWIASGSFDRTVRVWPMPDLSRRPLHAWPLDELLDELRSLTNVRVVEDSASTISHQLRTERGSGYELELEPFPGWARVPEWE